MESSSPTLSVVSYNCRGFNSSMPDVYELLQNYQTVFLQDTWLAKLQLDKLSTICPNHYTDGRADFDFGDGIFLGRGHGGTAIYWSKDIKASTFSNCDGSIIGLRVSLANSDLCLVNVYLPCCCPNNTDDFLEYLGKIKSLCDDLQCPNICFMGTLMPAPVTLLGHY